MPKIAGWSLVQLEFPEDCNVIFGQSHFIKTVEDLYEALVTSSPSLRFGIAFCEASGDCLIRRDGNDEELAAIAVANAEKIAAGHCFVIVLRNGYPINVLNRIKDCQEVCRIFAATANPLQVIVCESSQGRGVAGVIDGFPPRGVEGPEDVEKRKTLLRAIIGYKR
ncbi:MAG: adenosine-specific kinase [Aminivibrio sp.]